MVRFKNRWFLVEFIPVEIQGRAQLWKPVVGNSNCTPLDGQKIWVAFKESVLTNFGETAWGAIGLSLAVKYFSPTTNMCIIRVARDQHKIAWAASSLLSVIEEMRYIPNVVCVSGMIRHAQPSAISHNREVIARYRTLYKTANDEDAYETFLGTGECEIKSL